MAENHWNNNWYAVGQKAFSRSNRTWWVGVIEGAGASILIVLGVIFLVGTVTSNLLSESPADFYTQLLYYILQPLLAIAIVLIGGFLLVNVIWKVAASAERRDALVSKAGELEFLKEARRQSSDLPTVPMLSNGPFGGQHLKYRFTASRRSLWGLLTAGILCLLFAIVVAVLVVTAFVKWNMGRTDWIAGMLAIPISFAMLWSFYRFLKQLAKVASVGPTLLELASFPVMPGSTNEVFLSQSGRLRLKLLEVYLVCVEEATFNQGTNTVTQRKRVFSQRLFRKRGLNLAPRQPFQTRFEFEVPSGAMHSFQSSSNRVTWQIEVRGQIKGFPLVTRVYEIIVVPAMIEHRKRIRVANLQPA